MPSRDEVLASIAKLNSAPKQRIDEPEVAPRQSAAGVSNFQADIGRVRDRVTIQANAPAPQSAAETWEASVVRTRTESEQRGNEARARRQREAQERKAKIERERLRIENDRKALEEHREKQQRVFEENFIRREIKAILSDEQDPEILNEVIRRVKAAKMTRFAPAWSVFLDEVRAEKQK